MTSAALSSGRLCRLLEIARKRQQAEALHGYARRLALQSGREHDANHVSKEAAIVDAELRQLLADLQANGRE